MDEFSCSFQKDHALEQKNSQLNFCGDFDSDIEFARELVCTLSNIAKMSCVAAAESTAMEIPVQEVSTP